MTEQANNMWRIWTNALTGMEDAAYANEEKPGHNFYVEVQSRKGPGGVHYGVHHPAYAYWYVEMLASNADGAKYKHVSRRSSSTAFERAIRIAREYQADAEAYLKTGEWE